MSKRQFDFAITHEVTFNSIIDLIGIGADGNRERERQ